MSDSGSYSNAEVGTKLLLSLRKINDMYTNTYLSLGSSQGIYSSETNKVQERVNELELKVNTQQDAIEAYNREYLDRKKTEQPFT
jgi:hypothetical protein